MGFVQIFFVLQRRADTSPAVIGKSIFLIFQSLGRMIMLPICGGILFFQGWRLDPILQFGQFLLAIGILYLNPQEVYSVITISGDIELEEQKQVSRLILNPPILLTNYHLSPTRETNRGVSKVMSKP